MVFSHSASFSCKGSADAAAAPSCKNRRSKYPCRMYLALSPCHGVDIRSGNVHFRTGREFLMRHQVVIRLGGNRPDRIFLLRLCRGDLRGGLVTNLQRQPRNQRQRHHRGCGGKSEIADTLGGTVVGGEYGGFGLKSLVKGFSEASA